jgi:hypothetical protein
MVNLLRFQILLELFGGIGIIVAAIMSLRDHGRLLRRALTYKALGTVKTRTTSSRSFHFIVRDS